jgi:hypothetical protein
MHHKIIYMASAVQKQINLPYLSKDFDDNVQGPAISPRKGK